MAGVLFRATGKLFSGGDRAALLFSPSGEQLVLRLGFVLRGSEAILFPESLLDDWGHEITSLELYTWTKNYGPHFPRAELFGFDTSGGPQQCFVRDLDLTSRYACFVYQGADTAFENGVRLSVLLLSEPGIDPPKRLEKPAKLTFPLREAAVEWWSVDPADAKPLALARLGEQGAPDRQ